MCCSNPETQILYQITRILASGEVRRVDAASVYNVAQMALYGGMAAIIMRLKLFLTPQLCVVAGMLASKRQVTYKHVCQADLSIVLSILFNSNTSEGPVLE